MQKAAIEYVYLVPFTVSPLLHFTGNKSNLPQKIQLLLLQRLLYPVVLRLKTILKIFWISISTVPLRPRCRVKAHLALRDWKT